MFSATTCDANGTCQLSDIVISQRETGKVVGGKAQYQVTIQNKCSCPQANVKVRCDEINTVENVDKTKIRPIDREFCIIADGKPITKGFPDQNIWNDEYTIQYNAWIAIELVG
ncbi:hypothetical protein EJB05_24255, partial [Eragrostis curvula]